MKEYFDVFFSLIWIDFITDKIEETLGVDLNKDGRIGGPGPTAEIERATHIDINRDGIIGGYRPPADGGKRNDHWRIQTCFGFIGLVGKIEKATHIDINRDGRIGGGAYYPPQPKH